VTQLETKPRVEAVVWETTKRPTNFPGSLALIVHNLTERNGYSCKTEKKTSILNDVLADPEERFAAVELK
jgi:hypothetical protein